MTLRFLRRPLLAALGLAALTAGPAAGNGPAPPMAAAGVLERDGRTDCSAVLVAPARILTAAHCVTGKTLEAEGGSNSILFRTGAYPGHPSLERAAIRVMVHPMYLAAEVVAANVRSADIALLALETPIPPESVAPLVPGLPVGIEESVLVASYPGGQGDRARERRCPVLLADATLARLSCIVIPGESGAPVVRLTENGPELAGLVVATSRAGHQPYALTVQIEARLIQLVAVYGPLDP